MNKLQKAYAGKLLKLCKLPEARNLLQPKYKNNSNYLAGFCYLLSEAFHHKFPEFKPCHVHHEGSPHWFLVKGSEIVDLTAGQFSTRVDYSKGRRCGFLTKKPSKRTQVLIGLIQ